MGLIKIYRTSKLTEAQRKALALVQARRLSAMPMTEKIKTRWTAKQSSSKRIKRVFTRIVPTARAYCQ